MALRLSHYISFFYGTPTKIFNVGEYRREKAVAAGYGRFQPASFFNPANKEAAALRQSASEDALNHLLAWMETTAGAHTSKNDGKYVRALTPPPPVTLSRRDMVIVRAADAG